MAYVNILKSLSSYDNLTILEDSSLLSEDCVSEGQCGLLKRGFSLEPLPHHFICSSAS